jgi:hypothetical protein
VLIIDLESVKLFKSELLRIENYGLKSWFYIKSFKLSAELINLITDIFDLFGDLIWIVTIYRFWHDFHLAESTLNWYLSNFC